MDDSNLVEIKKKRKPRQLQLVEEKHEHKFRHVGARLYEFTIVYGKTGDDLYIIDVKVEMNKKPLLLKRAINAIGIKRLENMIRDELHPMGRVMTDFSLRSFEGSV